MGNDAGSFEVTVSVGGVGSGAMQDGIMLTIEACDETMDFRNARVVLTPTASSLKLMTGGPGSISAGAGLSIDVESDEEVPVVTFSTSSLNVDEEDDTSVYIVTTTMQGDEVGAVNVRVGGDALITLSQKGTALTANTDGTYTADFGMDANTQLTISADADESLHEGDQKVATVTIVDASGATVGDDDTVTVVVHGVGVEPEAVPALPLIAQWLLGLGLMGGGARQLFRRRRQG